MGNYLIEGDNSWKRLLIPHMRLVAILILKTPVLKDESASD